MEKYLEGPQRECEQLQDCSGDQKPHDLIMAFRPEMWASPDSLLGRRSPGPLPGSPNQDLHLKDIFRRCLYTLNFEKLCTGEIDGKEEVQKWMIP